MVFEADKQFLEYIKANKIIGYGRMMQIISSEWFTELEADAKGLGDGAAVANSLVAHMSDTEREEYLGIIEQEKEEGMEYGRK